MPHVGMLLSSASRKAGGLMTAVSRLSCAIAARRWQLDVFTLSDEWTEQDRSAWSPLVPRAFATTGPRAFGYSAELLRALNSAPLDLLHIHGLWMYPSIAALKWQQCTGRPHVISPHGMLEGWALRNAAFKKRVAAWLFEDRHLARAACIHVLSEAEYESVRAYGLRNPVCIIPNGVDLPDNGATTETGAGGQADFNALLYLGRLHTKKNLHTLIRAWAAARDATENARKWTLTIAGWDQGGYECKLKELAAELHVGDSVKFTGPKFREEKETAFRTSDAFVLPSLSEGLPMTVLEAWSYGNPVLMTKECNLPQGFAAGAAIEIGITAEAMADGLRRLFDMHEVERAAMGGRGRKLVAEYFTWARIAEEMSSVYDWLIRGGQVPDSVRLD